MDYKEKREILRGFIIVSAGIALFFMLTVFMYFEYKLISIPYTGIGDTAGAAAVVLGEDYYVVSTDDGGIENFESRADTCSYNVEQVVLAKFRLDEEYLMERGCTEVDRMGDTGYYEASGGLRFAVRRSYRAAPFFCTFVISGATMEEIEANG